MEDHAAEVLLRLRHPEHVAERHAFPDAVAERAAEVQAGHDLDEANALRLAQLQQGLEIQGRSSAFVSGLPIVAGFSGSAITSSFHVSRVRPTSLRLSSGSE